MLVRMGGRWGDERVLHMAENLLQIDDDWKKQAQEEKRRLAEEEAKKKAQATTAPAVSGAGAPGERSAGGGGGASSRRGAPKASFGGLVQTLMTQALFYLGELGSRTGQTMVDLDMARMQIDLLGVLEEKTQGNLTDEDKQFLDTAMYETRMRFVAVAREYAVIDR